MADLLVNEQGRPLYPKWVENKEGVRVIVQTPAEENEVAKKPETIVKNNLNKSDGWPTS